MVAESRSAIGIDIGSRMTKIVRMCNREIIDAEIFDTGHDPTVELREVMSDYNSESIVATGYGRRLVQSHITCRTVTEALCW